MDAYLEIQEAMLAAEAAGDIEGAEFYQSMLDEMVEMGEV